jgi:hypothetical protein
MATVIAGKPQRKSGQKTDKGSNMGHKDVHEVTIGSAIVVEGQSDLPLPHEHDESHHSQSGGPHEVMRQARRDIEDGIVDTDRRGAYGLGEGEGLKGQPSKPRPGK